MRLVEIVNRWLPPPAFMQMDGLGVDISESSIKYIGFKRDRYGSNPKLKLTDWGEVPVGEGVISRGEVKDVTALAKVLIEVKKMTGATYVRLSLPEERVYIFETEFEKGVEENSIRDLIEFKLEENVPLSPRDSYFDYRILSPLVDKGAISVVVTVAPKEIVDSYYEACLQAGLTPLSFEVESSAISRAVLPTGDGGASLLLDFGKTRTGLGIIYRGTLMYTSTVDIGGDELSNALRKTIGEKDESEYTKIKNETGLVANSNGTVAYEAMLQVVSAIKDEVSTRLQYWTSKEDQLDRSIKKIVLSGGSANLRGLTSYFSEVFGIETVLAKVWQNAFDVSEDVPPIDLAHSYGYATAIGLGLSSFNSSYSLSINVVNILPPEGKKKIKKERFIRLFASSLLAISTLFVSLIILSMPTWYSLAWIKISVANHASATSEKAYEQLSDDLKLYNSTIKHLQEVERFQNFSNLANDLDELGGPSISITQFSFDAGKKPKAIISGVAATRGDLSEFRDNLESDSRFSEVDLPLSSLVNDKDSSFSITFNLELSNFKPYE